MKENPGIVEQTVHQSKIAGELVYNTLKPVGKAVVHTGTIFLQHRYHGIRRYGKY